jgi:hypothetical protein
MPHAAAGLAELNQSLARENQALRVEALRLRKQVKLLRGGDGPPATPSDGMQLLFSLVLAVEEFTDYAQLRMCARVSRAVREHVERRLESLQGLSMCTKFVERSDVLRALMRLPADLQSLDFSRTLLLNSPERAKMFASMIIDAGLTRLTSLALSDVDLDYRSFGAFGRVLERNTSLERLVLSENRLLCGRNFEKTSGLSRLQVLDVSYTAVSPSAICNVLATTTVLTTLGMQGLLGDGVKKLRQLNATRRFFFNALKKQTSLKSLDMSGGAWHKYADLTDELLSMLNTTTGMRSLVFSIPHLNPSNFCMNMHGCLLKMRNLELLDLTLIPDDGWNILDVFGSCLEWPCLKVLRLQALSNVHDITCRSLVCMSGLPVLQNLSLVSSPSSSSSFSRFGIMRLCEALGQWTSLEELTLGSLVLPLTGEVDLCKALAALPRLRRLRARVSGEHSGVLRKVLEPRVTVTF